MAQEEQATAPAEASYAAWRADLRRDPEYARVYEEEAAKSELWLQLVEARQQAGVTQGELAVRLGVSQAWVARIEKRSDGCTLKTLHRYVVALGAGFTLDVQVRHHDRREDALAAATP